MRRRLAAHRRPPTVTRSYWQDAPDRGNLVQQFHFCMRYHPIPHVLTVRRSELEACATPDNTDERRTLEAPISRYVKLLFIP
jgi:hypothetical protein